MDECATFYASILRSPVKNFAHTTFVQKPPKFRRAQRRKIKSLSGTRLGVVISALSEAGVVLPGTPKLPVLGRGRRDVDRLWRAIVHGLGPLAPVAVLGNESGRRDKGLLGLLGLLGLGLGSGVLVVVLRRLQDRVPAVLLIVQGQDETAGQARFLLQGRRQGVVQGHVVLALGNVLRREWSMRNWSFGFMGFISLIYLFL